MTFREKKYKTLRMNILTGCCIAGAVVATFLSTYPQQIRNFVLTGLKYKEDITLVKVINNRPFNRYRFIVYENSAEIRYPGFGTRQPVITSKSFVDEDKDGKLDYREAYTTIKRYDELSLEERSIFNEVQEKYDRLRKQYSSYFINQ